MKTSAPLSKVQFGLYVECVAHQGEALYNIPYLYTFDGSLDEERLKNAIEAAVAAHPTLFTRIELDSNDDPVQTIDDEETFLLSVEKTNDIEAEKAAFIQPFDLLKDRLFRIRLLRDGEHYYLLQDIHHIISDGTSRQVLLSDIEKAYDGGVLEKEELTLAEVATAEAEQRGTPAFEADKQWYAQNFDCSDTYSPLLADLEESEPKEGLLSRTMGVDPSRVDAYCKGNAIFKSTFFTAAYGFLLAKYNNEQESLFCTIHNGRADKRLAHSVAMLVRSLPVYAKFDNDTTVVDFLKDGQTQMSGCREHEAYAYSDVVTDLGLQIASNFAWHGTLFAKEEFCKKPLQQQRLNNNSRECPIYVKAYSKGGRLVVEAEYGANEYSEAMVRYFLESYEAVVEGFLTKEYLREIALSTEEHVALLDGFNQRFVDYDDTQTIVSVFRRQVSLYHDKAAVVFKDKKYTYAEMDDLSDRIAAYVASKSLGREDVVSILIPRCEWMAIASMGVMKAGCAYQPLDPTYPAERLNFMMKDAGVRLLIADEELLSIVDEYKGDVLLTKDIQQLPQATELPEGPKTDNLFILLYTSGTTGVPKGVMLEQRNLISFCAMQCKAAELDADTHWGAYASFGFDACTMELWATLYGGGTVYIIPEEMRLDLMALNEYFEQNGITHTFMTTQVARQFVNDIDNHTLKYFMTGGEKLAGVNVPPYRLVNGYGPTESICFITYYPVTKKENNIPIGKVAENTRIYIVDPQGYRLPVGAAGELWIAGPQVSRGYLNRPDKTAEAYIANPFTTDEGYTRIYRSGDIVRYLPDGNLQFVGRRDGQVKIRGFRIELKEVETVIREFPGIKDATVQAFDEESGSGKYVAAYIVGDQKIDIEALNNFILEQKPPYMVPAVTMQIDAIPLNQNQKVNKRALPKPERKPMEAEAANVPMNVLETELHDMIADIVGSKDFGVTTNLAYAGLTSISAIKLAVQVSKRYDVSLDSKMLVKTGTLQSIENDILKKMMSGHSEAEPEVKKADKTMPASVPLSYAQTGVYLDCLNNPTSTIYNIPYLLTFPKGTDANKLAAAVEQVVKSHPELGVHFTTEGGLIVQTIDGNVDISFSDGNGGTISEMSEEKLNVYKNEFVRPFNLQKPPLYRFEIVKTENDVHLLMDIHHLVFDGGSGDLFIRQICAFIEGASVEKERYTYFDFVADQQAAEETDTFRAAQQFFAERLQNCEGASEIPYDLKKRGDDTKGFIGEAVCMPDFDKATAFCRQHGITPAHLFLAATAYVGSRYTNNRDVYLCTVSGGRGNLKIADTVGMFVNTLAIGLDIDDVSVADFLKHTSEIFDQTIGHEDYPFARIASNYGFQPSIAYAYQVGVLSEYTIGGEVVGQELLELNVPKFKINIKIESRGVVVQYDDSLYSARLGNALAESIVAVVGRMTDHPEGMVRHLSIVSPSQEEELAAIRQVVGDDAPFSLFHDCISHFAQSQPDHDALVAIDGRFSYGEMEKITNSMASALRKRGVEDRDRVALLLPRTSRLILSLFGVMKAGAAYIPCDPEYPADRVKLILEDSEARFIITTADRIASVPAEKAINVEDLIGDNSAGEEKVITSVTPDDLAYLIYTSGSTGRPKGVMLRHSGICNYLYGHPANVLAHAVKTDAERVLSVTTISFDAALQDIGHAYFNGKTLILATEEQANNPLDLARLINEHEISMVSGTPSRWQTWLTSSDFCDAISHVKICRAGGEKFSDQLLSELRSVTKARIFNCYGPTETTVASNNKELTAAQQITVGRPQLNVVEYIVDSDGNELPVGVVGELYIGGRGVARGYNNLDKITREHFVDYSPHRNGETIPIYKSGDYAKWQADGDVVILGRTDHQIKLRGLRIELGEIENVMLKVKGMKKVIILIRRLNDKEHLCAYYTADREIAPENLKAEISKSLTQYMVPTAYLQLEEMPMTPNGKTDVKALPEPQLATSSVFVAPANDTERNFCDIFASILQIDKVGATDNFFELGGTSLVVTRVIIEADKMGLHVAYGDVFANPTPRQLAALTSGGSDGEETDEISGFDYTAINILLQRNTLSNFRKGERRPLGNVLLTGATGYLGIHILRELIDSDAENIYCLVRGTNAEKAESRLRTLLFYYFVNAYRDLFGKRIYVITGNVTDDLGQLISQYSDKPLNINTVINCAAVVKHFSESTEIEDVNIGGAKRCVDYCLQNGARLIHVSTASTRGLWTGEPQSTIFTEQRLYIGQYLGNKYIHSKFLAERLILNSVALHGLDAKIMRVGNLAARSTDGEFQANFSTNSFMGRIRVYNMLGCCPYGLRNKRVEFSPINEVAHAIILLSTTPKECTVFHPYNIHNQFLGDVLTGLWTVGDGIRFVEQEEFAAAMEHAKEDPQKAKQMSALLAYQDMAHGLQTTDVSRDNDYTTQVLYRLGFAWSPTSWDYVERMLTAIGGFGFFE